MGDAVLVSILPTAKDAFQALSRVPGPAKIHQKQKRIDGTPVPSCYMRGGDSHMQALEKACDSWQSKNNFWQKIVSQTIPAIPAFFHF